MKLYIVEYTDECELIQADSIEKAMQLAEHYYRIYEVPTDSGNRVLGRFTADSSRCSYSPEVTHLHID